MKSIFLAILTEIVVSVGMLAGPIAAIAVPIHYSESVSGDLPPNTYGSGPPLPVFQFGTGNNTISGETSFLFNQPIPGSTCHFCVDGDSFIFEVPVGSMLASISLNFVLHPVDESLYHAVAPYYICPGDVSDPTDPFSFCQDNRLGFELVNYLDDTRHQFTDFDNILPLGAGRYTFRSPGAGANVPGWRADYTWTFRIVPARDRRATGSSVPVPEPSTGTLVLAGLSISGFRRRRWIASAA